MGALALDVPVRQKHALDRIVELLDRPDVDQTSGFEAPIDILCQRGVLRGMGAVPVIEAQREAVQILTPPRGDAPDQLLGCHPIGLGLEHDGCTVCVIRAHKMHPRAHHPLESHPDVNLDVLHDVADVQGAIGVGQGTGNEEFA